MVQRREIGVVVVQELSPELLQLVERRAHQVEALHGDRHERKQRLPARRLQQPEQLLHLLGGLLLIVLRLVGRLADRRMQLEGGAEHLLLADAAEHKLIFHPVVLLVPIEDTEHREQLLARTPHRALSPLEEHRAQVTGVALAKLALLWLRQLAVFALPRPEARVGLTVDARAPRPIYRYSRATRRGALDALLVPLSALLVPLGGIAWVQDAKELGDAVVDGAFERRVEDRRVDADAVLGQHSAGKRGEEQSHSGTIPAR